VLAGRGGYTGGGRFDGGCASPTASGLAWFAILFIGRYPRGIFDHVEGVTRRHDRVVGYGFIVVTDRYPPFALGEPEPGPGASAADE
jgi:hypothetical protein